MTRNLRVGNGKRGAVKGVPIYKKTVLTSQAIRGYYWIQDYIARNGKGPRYCDIGWAFGGSRNYYTARNTAIRQICEPLEEYGYIKRVGEGRYSQIALTDKPMTDVNLIVPTEPKRRHNSSSPKAD